MKKIMLATSLAALSASPMFVQSAYADIALAAGVTNVTTVTASGCGLLASSVNVNLSAANIGYASCNTSTGSIGASVANTTGKFVVHSIGSAGGSMTSASQSSTPSATDVQNAATTRAASS